MIIKSKTTISTHLAELKSRLLKSSISVIICSIIAFYYSDNVLEILVAPLMAHFPDKHFIFTGISDMFFITVHVAICSGLLISMPYILWQLYAFLKPGLYDKEKSILVPFLIASPTLFLFGALFAFYFILPMAWKFLLSFEINDLQSNNSIYFQPRINEYLSTVFSLLIVFGTAFQLPLIINALILFEIISTDFLITKRRLAILVIFCISALITPPDALSQIALAIPLILLYELSIISGKKLEKLKQSSSGGLKDA
jgi:sec-independent protein translocase protein TatC